MKGKVWLVGAGPGDPELLTMRAFKLLQEADVVLHDDLVGAEILALIPRRTPLYNVGKRCGRQSIRQETIHSLLVNFGSFGLTVVRLKSGDPMLFGRGGEEIEALQAAGIEVEVVPGVTAALGAAAAAGISLTDRRKASAVAFLTAHHAKDSGVVDWKPWVASGATLVIYMPGYDYEQISTRLMEAGMRGETPCAIVSRATSKQERIVHTVVAALPAAEHLPAPTLLLVGEVVGRTAEVAVSEFVDDRGEFISGVLSDGVFVEATTLSGD